MADKDRRRKHEVLMKSPVGVLAIHLKTLELTGIQPEFRGLSYYVRICAANQMKHTGVYSDISPPVKIMFDELKTFRLEISSKRHCDENNVRIEVIRFNPRSGNLTHEVAGRLELHVYEILKHLFNVATYDFAFSGTFHAHLETEICFSYGEFGYGFSNQIQNQSVSVAEQLGHSMFTFIEPSKDRSREEHALHIMTCLPVGHPEFLEFPAKAEHLVAHEMHISTTHINKQAPFTNCTAEYLMEKIGKRLHKVQTEYQKCKSRSERLSFVASVVNFEPRGSNYTNLEEHTFNVTEAFHNHLHHKTYAMGKRDPFAYYNGPAVSVKGAQGTATDSVQSVSKLKAKKTKSKTKIKAKKKGMKQVVKSPLFMMRMMMDKVMKKRRSTSSDAESETSGDEEQKEEDRPQKEPVNEEPPKPMSAMGNLIMRLKEAKRAEEEAAAAQSEADDLEEEEGKKKEKEDNI